MEYQRIRFHLRVTNIMAPPRVVSLYKNQVASPAKASLYRRISIN
jgi:hypothetical protein